MGHGGSGEGDGGVRFHSSSSIVCHHAVAICCSKPPHDVASCASYFVSLAVLHLHEQGQRSSVFAMVEAKHIKSQTSNRKEAGGKPVLQCSPRMGNAFLTGPRVAAGSGSSDVRSVSLAACKPRGFLTVLVSGGDTITGSVQQRFMFP